MPAPAEIFKAYDVRGLYGEQIDGDVAEQIGRAFVRVLADLSGKPAGDLRVGLGPRHAPDRAGAGRALPGGHGRRGRPRPRRRAGRHRDALLPRRLARARRRADVHRLAQPEGLHGREARARGGHRAVRRPGIQDIRGADRRRPRRRRPAGGSCEDVDIAARVPGGGADVHRPGERQADEGRRRRRQRHGRPDGRPAARPPPARPRQDLLGAGRQLPRPRAQPAARGEPAVHRRQGPRGGRRPRHRLGRRRRPLLLHRRHRPLRRRRLPHRDPRRAPAGQASRASSILYDVRASRAVPDIVARGGRHAPSPTASATRSSRPACATRARSSAARSPATTTSTTSTTPTAGTVPALLDPREALGRGQEDERAARAATASRYFISGEINSEVADRPAGWPRSRSATPTGARSPTSTASVDYDDWHFNVRPSNTEPLLRLCLESLVSEEDMERRRDEVLGAHPLVIHACPSRRRSPSGGSTATSSRTTRSRSSTPGRTRARRSTRWRRALRDHGRRVEDLERIVVTHQHIDHIGLVRSSCAARAPRSARWTGSRRGWRTTGEHGGRRASPRRSCAATASRRTSRSRCAR